MKIQIISIGTKLASWSNEAVDDYLSRFRSFNEYDISLLEIPAQKRGKSANIDKIIDMESQALIDAVPHNYIPIALDVGGKSFSSEKLATSLQNFHDNGENIAILIGGPEGFNQKVRSFVRYRWSLSQLTLPHPIARVIS